MSTPSVTLPCSSKIVRQSGEPLLRLEARLELRQCVCSDSEPPGLEARGGYDSSMAAKVVSPRVQHIVEEAAEPLPGELAELIEAIQSLPRRAEAMPERHAVIAERVARAQAGAAPTLSVDEVEQSLRRDLDF